MAILDEIRKTDHLIRRQHPHEPGAPILRVNELEVRYQSGAALRDVSFELVPGERLAVVGPNGAGKSTLFKVIAGVQKPTGGQIHVYGHEPGGHICIAYIQQRSQVDWNFPVNVSDTVMMGRIGKLKLFHHPGSKDWEVVRESLEVVGMTHLARRQISELSGGQQQRVFIARALAQEAELMLMDEPLTGLDVNSQDKIFRVLDNLRTQGVTVLVAMHDLQLAAERFDRVMLLNEQLLGLGSPGEVFTSQNLIDAYGGHLRMIQTDDGVLAVEDTCCGEGDDL